MPRARKTQPVQAPKGRAYGERKAIEQAQRAAPLPQQGSGGALSPSGMSVQLPPMRPGRNTPSLDPSVTAAAEADAQSRLGSALQAAAQARFSPVGIGAPTARPTEPLTAGLPIGPGPGPTPRPRLADTLRQVASRSGDLEVARLASMVEQMGW